MPIVDASVGYSELLFPYDYGSLFLKSTPICSLPFP